MLFRGCLKDVLGVVLRVVMRLKEVLRLYQVLL